ncbi:hypothetical protein IFR05_016940 [Cadophora sp. M221]|nr:hypothetical protein IFR05_016940 [Cadophora sp. M221]
MKEKSTVANSSKGGGGVSRFSWAAGSQNSGAGKLSVDQVLQSLEATGHAVEWFVCHGDPDKTVKTRWNWGVIVAWKEEAVCSVLEALVRVAMEQMRFLGVSVEAVDKGEDGLEDGIPNKADLQKLRELALNSREQLWYSSWGSGSTMEGK